jgi:hypothetical protein
VLVAERHDLIAQIERDSGAELLAEFLLERLAARKGSSPPIPSEAEERGK